MVKKEIKKLDKLIQLGHLKVKLVKVIVNKKRNKINIKKQLKIQF